MRKVPTSDAGTLELDVVYAADAGVSAVAAAAPSSAAPDAADAPAVCAIALRMALVSVPLYPLSEGGTLAFVRFGRQLLARLSVRERDTISCTLPERDSVATLAVEATATTVTVRTHTKAGRHVHVFGRGAFVARMERIMPRFVSALCSASEYMRFVLAGALTGMELSLRALLHLQGVLATHRVNDELVNVLADWMYARIADALSGNRARASDE